MPPDFTDTFFVLQPLLRVVWRSIESPQTTAGGAAETQTRDYGSLRAETSPAFQAPKAFLRAQDLDFKTLPAAAIATEADEDHEEHDNLSDVDDEDYALNPVDNIDWEYPAPPPLDPFNEVDDIQPPPLKEVRRSPSFDEVVAAAVPPHSGPHRQRPAKHKSDAEIARAKKGSKRCKVEKRTAAPRVPRTSTIRQFIHGAEPFATSLDTAALPVARGAYGAKVEQPGEKWGSKKCRSLTELIFGLNFRLIRWNGIDPCPLIDSKGRIFAVLAGQPRDPTYKTSVAAAFGAIMQEGTAARFPAIMRKHRRGLFAAINVGLTFGKGQKVPTVDANRLHRHDRVTACKRACRENGDICELCVKSFNVCLEANCLCVLQLPLLFGRHGFMSTIARKTQNSASTYHTFLGFPPTQYFHAPLSTLGPTSGRLGIATFKMYPSAGRPPLWELKLVIEFPAGALILLPSATITHSNIPVQEGDTRVSFTQFTAGALMRYVDNGFRTSDELQVQDLQEFACLEGERDRRWEMGLGLLSTMDELTAAHV
ncbi:hypothetical protein B0H19DRAFT_1253833 [Mycena capillaripes]|nr:hypothetical protein B0H19DRAFT_1253833 [Mycena capillaripes]